MVDTKSQTHLNIFPFFPFSFMFSLCTPPFQAAEIDGALVVALKRIVCNIEQSVEYALRQEKVGVFTGTGFVVYLSKSIALVATNEHLSGISPQQVKLTFENGATCEAQGPVWVDPWHDLSFYKFNPAELEYEELACAEIGSSLTLQEQTPVLLIGNNDQEEYSVKFGRVTNLQLGSGDRHSASFQSSFDRTKGSSGSPVFDQRGKVVGIHMRGTHTTSIELRVEYIKKALDQLVKVDPSGEVTITGHVQRGELGLELQLTRASLVKQHFQFPQKLLTELRNSRPKLKQVLLVYKVVPITSPAFKAGIQAGDVIWSVNGTVVGTAYTSVC
jgi:S1-C subfamily serine protease